MRGLSIQHPWAAAIAYGTKTVENRSWRAPGWAIGQVIAIHASKKPDISARPPAGESWPEHRMHLGAVIAVAELAGCHDATYAAACSCSPWAQPESWHWELTSVRPLPRSRPLQGHARLVAPAR